MPRTSNKSTKTVLEAVDITENTSNIGVEPIVEVKLNMDEKITVRNIANWMVGFNKIESAGEVNINPNGSVRITRAEVISQFENGNKLICGVGDGKHATIYIDDKATRDYLECSGNLINKNLVKKIFEIEGINDFKNKIKDTFVTRAEKMLLIEIIRTCDFNDFNKIRECEILCGINV